MPSAAPPGTRGEWRRDEVGSVLGQRYAMESSSKYETGEVVKRVTQFSRRLIGLQSSLTGEVPEVVAYAITEKKKIHLPFCYV